MREISKPLAERSFEDWSKKEDLRLSNLFMAFLLCEITWLQTKPHPKTYPTQSNSSHPTPSKNHVSKFQNWIPKPEIVSLIVVS